MGLAASLRSYTSISHIQGAARQARETHVAQDLWTGTGGPMFDEDGGQAIVDHAVASILLSVAFVEANVNELLIDCHENVLEGPSRKALSPSLAAGIGELWPGPNRWPTSKKWADIVALVGKEHDARLDREWRFLNRLRNSLIHAKPESVTVLSTEPDLPESVHSLEPECRIRFVPNPKVVGRAGFLLEWMAYPAAAWAVTSALAYSDHLWETLQAPPPYDHVRERLRT